MYTASVVEALPGPPPVRIYTSLKTRNAPVTVVTHMTKVISFTCGSVTLMKRRKRPAPSISAAS